MQLTFLGTGTSAGIPVIGCRCVVCQSGDPKDKRTRSSVLLRGDSGQRLLIDASSDLREQALRENIDELEDILITHVHADHVFGLSEIRPYNQQKGLPVRIYLEERADLELRQVFQFAYRPPLQTGGGIPQIENRIIEPDKTFQLGEFKITPFRIWHGKLPILAFRINELVYITDASEIPEASKKYLQKARVLVLNALREKKHTTHFSLEEAVAIAQEAKAPRTFFTHIAHNLGHASTNQKLPAGFALAHDGLTLQV